MTQETPQPDRAMPEGKDLQADRAENTAEPMTVLVDDVSIKMEALRIAHNSIETPEQVVTRARMYISFLTGTTLAI